MIPILIFHTGKTYYLRAVIEQARLYNPMNDIFLVSDISTKDVASGLCSHELMSDYHHYVDKFLKVYVHHSTCSVQFETFCLSRWFVMKEFMEKHHFDYAVSIDSDFLLYESVDEIFKSNYDYEYNICGKGCSPHCTMFSLSSLTRFCDFIMEMYREGELNRCVVEEFNKKYDAGVEGGICDMTAFRWYEKLHPGASVDMAIPKNGRAIDDSLYSSSGYVKDESHKMPFKNKEPKRIIWKDDFPYGIWEETGEQIRFMGIHLQGAAKLKMYKFLHGQDKKRKGFWFAVKWSSNPEILKFVYNTLKKNQKLVIKKLLRKK